MADRKQLARDMFDAYVEKDREKIEVILAPDFRFTSPLDNKLDRETYFERCWPNSDAAERFDYIYVGETGDQVFVTYEAIQHGHGFRNTEVITFRGDQAISVEVYFGWNVPHEADEGGWIEDDEDDED